MKHWYSKETGGLEQLTGIPYSELGCQNCHAAGCDRCHKTESVEGDCKVLSYSTRTASKPDMCLVCHGREKAMIGIDHKANGMHRLPFREGDARRRQRICLDETARRNGYPL